MVLALLSFSLGFTWKACATLSNDHSSCCCRKSNLVTNIRFSTLQTITGSLKFNWLSVSFTFVLIGLCDCLRFCFVILNRSEL